MVKTFYFAACWFVTNVIRKNKFVGHITAWLMRPMPVRSGDGWLVA